MSDEKHRIVAQLGGAAESYLDSEVHRLGADHETLAPWCRDVTHALDMATGAGHTASTIADIGVSSVVATDAAPETVATAVREYPVTGIVAGAERLPFTDDIFDTTACRIATHHFPDPEAFVAEVVRILELGGVLAFEDNVAPEDAALVTFFSSVEVPHDSTYVELHPVSRWREQLAAAGLSVETVGTTVIRLQFNPWIEWTNISPADRDEPKRRFREAPEEAKELFGMKFDGDSVVSFANPKTLIRARTE